MDNIKNKIIFVLAILFILISLNYAYAGDCSGDLNCDYNTESLCKNYLFCHWINAQEGCAVKSGVSTSCSKFTDQNTCSNTAGCTWNLNLLNTFNINQPVLGLITSNPLLTVSGNSFIGTAKVLVKLNEGNWEDASGTRSWTKSFTLTPGLNLIKAKALITANQESSEDYIAITYKPVTPPIISQPKLIERRFYGSECPNTVNFKEGNLCKEFNRAGEIIYEYDDSLNIIRTITTDNYYNFLTNPSFEITTGNAASYWGFYGSANQQYTDQAAHTEKISIKMNKAQSNEYSGMYSAPLYLTPNKEYTLSAYIKGTNVNNFWVEMHCRNLGSTVTNFNYDKLASNQVASGTFDWKRYYLVFKPHTTADYCIAVLFFDVNTGKADQFYIDDIKLQNGRKIVDDTKSYRNTFAVDYSYDKSNHITRIIDPNDVVSSYTMDGSGAIKETEINNLVLNSGFQQQINDGNAIYWDQDSGAATTSGIFSTDYKLKLSPGIASQIDIPMRFNNYIFEAYVRSGTINVDLDYYDNNKNKISTFRVGSFNGGLLTYDKVSAEFKTPLNIRYANLIISGDSYIDDVSIRKKGSETKKINIDYTPSSKISKIDYGNVQTNLLYDKRDLVKSIETKKDSSSYFKEDYSYDPSGNLKEINSPTGKISFSYDFLHRLQLFANLGFYLTLPQDYFYSYDVFGNILTTSEQAYSYYPGTDRLKEDNNFLYEYSGTGKLIKKTSELNPSNKVIFSYNEKDLLSQVDISSENKRINYYYNGNLLQRKEVNGRLNEIYIYDLQGALLYRDVYELCPEGFKYDPDVGECIPRFAACYIGDLSGNYISEQCQARWRTPVFTTAYGGEISQNYWKDASLGNPNQDCFDSYSYGINKDACCYKTTADNKEYGVYSSIAVKKTSKIEDISKQLKAQVAQ